MRVCQVYGDMLADKSSDNYPTEVFCDECYDDMDVDSEDSRIVQELSWDSSCRDNCSRCGKSQVDEKAENEA